VVVGSDRLGLCLPIHSIHWNFSFFHEMLCFVQWEVGMVQNCMMSMDAAERSDWFNEECTQTSFSSRSGTSLTQSSIKAFYQRRLARRSCRRFRIVLRCTTTSQDLLSFKSKRGTCWRHSRLLRQMLYYLIGVNWERGNLFIQADNPDSNLRERA
jgi:hypothetical protein